MATQSLRWTLSHFVELGPEILYQWLQLRHRVFALEQICLYEDLDDQDQSMLHLLGWRDTQPDSQPVLVVGARVELQSPDLQKTSKIGRVVCASEDRGQGYATELIKRAIEVIREHGHSEKILIHAQVHLVPYYRRFGFREIEQPYLLDGIFHQDMSAFVKEDIGSCESAHLNPIAG